MARTLTIDGRIIELKRPLVMGIINVTPDSFYAGSRAVDADAVLWKASVILEQGADILDIGACSTRPGSEPVSEEEERSRLEAPLSKIRSAFPDALLSLDTFYPGVAEWAVGEFGVDIINDVSGGNEEMYQLAAESGAGYVLTHSRGTSATMQSLTHYEDVCAEVLADLAFRLDRLRDLGCCNVIVDPGFGFAKTLDQNYQLMRNLEAFQALDAPLLVGVSRKSMVTGVCGSDPSAVLAGTIALNSAAMIKGADIIRVHDVKEAVAAVNVIDNLISYL